MGKIMKDVGIPWGQTNPMNVTRRLSFPGRDFGKLPAAMRGHTFHPCRRIVAVDGQCLRAVPIGSSRCAW